MAYCGQRTARASAAGGDCRAGISRSGGGREFSSHLSIGCGWKLRAGKREWFGAGGGLEPRRGGSERGEDGAERFARLVASVDRGGRRTIRKKSGAHALPARRGRGSGRGISRARAVSRAAGQHRDGEWQRDRARNRRRRGTAIREWQRGSVRQLRAIQREDHEWKFAARAAPTDGWRPDESGNREWLGGAGTAAGRARGFESSGDEWRYLFGVAGDFRGEHTCGARVPREAGNRRRRDFCAND